MTPRFSAAIDPVFMHVLNLLERIGNGEDPAPQEERLRIRGLLDQAEAQLGRTQEWELAKYALVAWIDEMLIVESPWEGRAWWKENSLEWDAFKTNLRHERYYQKAKEASGLPQRDALETFYVCVVLGFRGLYRDPVAAAALAEPLQLAPNLETWARETSMAIQLGAGRPPIAESSRTLEGAPPLNGPAALVWACFFGLVIASLLVIVVWLFMSTGAS